MDNEPNIIEEETPTPAPEPEEKPSRRIKRKERVQKWVRNPLDLRFPGPLSYRFLRIIAWIAFACGQLAFVNTIGGKIGSAPIGPTGELALDIISFLATPLFVIATFGLILNHKKSYKSFLILFGCGFLAIAVGLCLFYLRYVEGLFVKIGLQQEAIDAVKEFFKSKVNVNVFADLFACVLFHFFLTYTPMKRFRGKKIAGFRAFVAVPIAYVIASYVIRVLAGGHFVDFPFYVIPFLTTKPPLMFAMFAVVSLWLKNRKKVFARYEIGDEDYDAFLKTRRNSFSFSIHLISAIGVVVLIDALLVAIFLIHGTMVGLEIDAILAQMDVYKVGHTVPLILAIPFLFFYSYTKTHKNSNLDIIIPIAGVGLSAIVYLEGIYDIVIKLVTQS